MFASAAVPPPLAAWEEGLNDEQRAAVVHGDGPLMVVAGAGSGKTRTLAARVARLIGSGVQADRILLLTFTRRAAREMLTRADALAGASGTRQVWGGTFHGVANRLLRRYGDAVGLSAGFTIIDQADAGDLFAILRTDLGIATTEKRFPRPETIVAIYSRVANAQESLSEVVEQRFPWCGGHLEALRDLFRAYGQRKRELNTVDYDDLLLYWQELLVSPAAAVVKAMFDHVLVDEYQDTNRVQGEILLRLVGRAGNLTVVGDDAQAIYSFRAASIENMTRFTTRFEDPVVIKLEQNYRSTPEILNAANRVIARSDVVTPKRLWSDRPPGPRPELVTCLDEAAQAAAVADRILKRLEAGISLRDQCVLFRTAHHSAGLEIELGRRGIPFVKFGGLRFLEALMSRMPWLCSGCWRTLATSWPGIECCASSPVLGR